MAASNWFIYGPALEAISNGTIDLDSDTFRMALVTSGYTPAQTTHDTWSDVSASEVANGGGYTTSGKLLTQSVSRSGLAVTFDADDQTWSASTITAKYAVIVRDADANGSLAGTDLVVAYQDLVDGGGSGSSTSESFTVGISASGVFTLTADAAT